MRRTYTDGEPYYCEICGLGYGEYMACEDIDCKLESKEEAMKRCSKASKNDNKDKR